jgi:PAS domain S-box-containing protein
MRGITQSALPGFESQLMAAPPVAAATPPPASELGAHDYKTLFESAPGLFLVLSPDLRIVAVNDQYLRATMTVRDEIVGRPLFDVFPENPDDPHATGMANVRRSLERVLATKAPDAMAVQKYDIRRPASAGGQYEERFWSPVNSPVLDEAGNLKFIIHRVEDVTEFVRLKRHDSAANGESQAFRQRAERMEAEIYQRSQQLAALNEQLRSTNQSLEGQIAERIRAERRAESLAAALQKLNDELESRVHRRTAELASVNQALVLEKQERQRAYQQFCLAVESAPNAMIMVDQNGRIILVNVQTERLFGYGREELLGQEIELLVPERFRRRHPEFRAAFFAQPTVREMGAGRELFGRRKDGSEVPIEIGLNPIQSEHGFFVLSAIVDITERRRAEAALYERTLLTVLTADVGMALNRSGRLQEVLRDCCQSLVNHLDAAFARIWTVNEAENVLELQASAGIYTHIDGPHARVPIGAFKIGLIAQERQPHLTNDVLNDPRVSNPQWAREQGLVAFAGYPLIVEERLVGVMAMFARHALSPLTLDAMATVANQIAAGIERKRHEDRLQFTQFTIDHLSTAVFWSDPSGRFFNVNEAACRLTGYARDELLQLALEDVDPAVTPQVWQETWDLLHRQGSLFLESRLVCKDGREIPISVHTNLMRIDGREFLCTLVEDISKRREAERRLAVQHQVTRILSESATLAEAAPRVLQTICEGQGWDVACLRRLDAQGNPLDSPEVWRQAGVHGEEFEQAARHLKLRLEQGLSTTNEPRNEPVWVADLAGASAVARGDAAATEGLASALAVPIRAPRGVLGVLELFSRRVAEPGPEVRELFSAISSQIGQFMERTEAEEARRQSEARYREISRQLMLQIERMPLAYLLFDADFRLVDWNPAAERIFGYRKEDVLGIAPPYEKLVPKEFHASVGELLERIRRGDMGAHSVNDNLTKDGRRITCEWINTPLENDAGQFSGLLSLANDITERRKLEEQFRQSQKMEAIGKLAGGVAHDFNNLLTIILGYCDMLQDSLRAEDPLAELVGEIRHAGMRAADMTRQLLAFSRKQVLVPAVLNLNKLLADMEKMLSRLIGEDVDLAVRPAAQLWPIRVDPGQMEQIIMNLIVNARDAMPQGGRLTIETASVELDEHYTRTRPDARPGAYVLLAISDTGCGMDRATLARIFEPFFSTKGEMGTGLGLATVYGIVKQSGGHIAVYSEPGCGSTFKVYLPRDAESMQAEPSAPPAEHQGGTETVLLVEDEDGVRSLARHTLLRQGYHVLEARHGGEALLLCERHPDPIHLLATDVVMPQMSGRELAERLLPLRPEMQVLYMSGYMDDAIVRHGLINAGVPFLQKPYTPAALAAKVREVLDKRSRR